MNNPSLRLLILLQHMPREPAFVSSQTLREIVIGKIGSEVSLRTIQRDLALLSAYFPLIQSEPDGVGKTGMGWAFLRDSQNISFPLMGSAAALSFNLGMQHLQQLMPPQALEYLRPYQQEAEKLLQAHDNQKFQSWLAKVRVAPQHFLQPAQLKPDVIESIYQALLENRQFRASYKDVPERIIHPYGLVQQGHTLYLLCRFFGFDDVRITALQRYSDVQVLEEEVRPFPEFNIDDYLQQGAMQWLVAASDVLELELRVEGHLLFLLQETPIAENQVIQPDPISSDLSIVRAKVRDSHQLRYWLLSQCSQLEVLQPQVLRDWLAKIARDQAGKYLT